LGQIVSFVLPQIKKAYKSIDYKLFC